MNTVAIVDYGLCNLDSVARAVEECGAKAVITTQPKDVETASRIILPGVGAFPEAMRNLKQLSLDEVLYDQAVEKQIPFLGICLGMQLLASKGWEMGESSGLGLILGEVHRLTPTGEDNHVPHVGWNEVWPVRDSPLFKGIPAGQDFYFVHSYELKPKASADVLAQTPYAGGFVSAVQSGLTFGVQFHPEKSQKMGFQLLKNFLAV